MVADIHDLLDRSQISDTIPIRFCVAPATDHTIVVQRATSRTDQEIIMAIGSAIERGSLIVVFDERGMTLFSKARGNGPNDGLLGFTSSTVTARYGSVIYTYDETGTTVYAKAA